MPRKVASLNTSLPAGSQFPAPVLAEIRAVIAQELGGPLANREYRDPAYIEPIPRIYCPFDVPMETGLVRMMLFTMRDDADVDAILTQSVDSSTHAAATKCRVGIYRAATPDESVTTLTCVARSASNPSRWNGGKVDVAPIVDDGAGTPNLVDQVTLEAGERYAAVAVSVGHTGSPKLACMGGFRAAEYGPPVGFTWGGFTDLTATIAGGSIEEWSVPWMALRIAE